MNKTSTIKKKKNFSEKKKKTFWTGSPEYLAPCHLTATKNQLNASS